MSAKYTYRVEALYHGNWVKIVSDKRDYCLGYANARQCEFPRNAMRLVRSDGHVEISYPASEEVNIGMIAGWPTPEQYEEAAAVAMRKAKKLREMTIKHNL